MNTAKIPPVTVKSEVVISLVSPINLNEYKYWGIENARIPPKDTVTTKTRCGYLFIKSIIILVKQDIKAIISIIRNRARREKVFLILLMVSNIALDAFSGSFINFWTSSRWIMDSRISKHKRTAINMKIIPAAVLIFFCCVLDRLQIVC